MATARFDVFLCHNRTDRQDVEYIESRLRATGLKPFLDTWNLIPGEPLVAQIEEALANCETVAVFLGKSGRSPWQNLEINTILNQRATSGGRVIPVFLPGADPNDAPSLLKSYLWVEFPKRDDEEAFRQLISGIRGVAVLPAGIGAESAEEKPVQPYRGLQYFDVADAPLFAGRDSLTARAISKIEAQLANQSGPRFLAVVGPSGSGKSSLARAGIIASMLAAETKLCYAIATPGQYPLESLAVAMLKACGKSFDGQDLATSAAAYRDNRRRLTQDAIAALAGVNGYTRFLLLVDQFEQMFSSGAARADCDAAIENICELSTDSGVRAVVMITIRDDFIGECARNPTLAQLLEQQILIPPMTESELREAIVKPAVAARVRVDSELTRALINDCEGEVNALPLLEFVLYKLWESAAGSRVLTIDQYEKLGGLVGALNRHADGIYNDLKTQPLQDAAKRIFLALVQTSRSARDARQSCFVEDLLPSTGDAEEVRTTERALGILSGEQARLITIRGAPGPGTGNRSIVELSHEVLIRSWERLRAWLNADREFLLWRERLRVSISDWQQNPKDEGVYLHGTLLDQALNWLKQRPAEHSPEEKRYIDVCRARRTAAKRRRMVVMATQAGGVLALIAVLWLPFRYSKQRLLTDTRASIASNSDAGLVLALHALGKHPGYETQSLLQEAVHKRSQPVLIGLAGRVIDMTFLPDHRHLAIVVDQDSQARVCPSGSNDPCRTFSAGADPLTRIAANATQLVAGTEKGAIHLWGLDSRQEQPGPALVPGQVTALTIGPDQSIIYATSGNGNRIHRWQPGMQSSSVIAEMAEKVNDVATAEGRFTATGNDTGLYLFDKLTGKPKRLTNPSGIAGYVLMTSDGRKVATIPTVGSLYLWDFETAHASPVKSLHGIVLGGGMSRDGKRLFTINRNSEDRLSISIWDESLAELYHFGLPAEPITRAVISADGSRIAAAVKLPGNEGAVRVFELDPAELSALAQVIVRTKDPAPLMSDCDKYLKVSECAKYIGETK